MLNKWSRFIIKNHKAEYAKWLFVSALSEWKVLFIGLFMSELFAKMEQGNYPKAFLFIGAVITLNIMGMILFEKQSKIDATCNVEIQQRIKYYIISERFDIVDDTQLSQGEMIDVMSRDVNQIAEYFQEMYIALPLTIVNLCATVSILLYKDVRLTVFVGIPMVIVFQICNHFAKIMEDVVKQRRDAEGEFARNIEDVVNNLRVIKMNRVGENILKQVEENNNQLKQVSVKQKIIETGIRIISSESEYIAEIILLATMILLEGTLSVGKFYIFQDYLSWITAIIATLSETIVIVKETRVSATRVHAMMPEREESFLESEHEASLISQKEEEVIIFHDENGEKELYPGKVNVITGPVGSGKSTLIKQLMGLRQFRGYLIYHGRQYANLQEMQEFSIGYSPQAPQFMNDTFLNNITLHRALDEELYEKVIDIAQLKTDIQSFEKEEEKELGNNGAKLSGGQKQRLSIARMLYGNHNFWIVDDVSSALDDVTFLHMWEEICKMKKETDTVLVVSNHPKIKQQADHVICC